MENIQQLESRQKVNNPASDTTGASTGLIAGFSSLGVLAICFAGCFLFMLWAVVYKYCCHRKNINTSNQQQSSIPLERIEG
jgi:hypothetical protein